MKKSDIKFGTEYAVGDKWDSEHWNLRRALATGPGITKSRNSWSSRSNGVTGTEIQFLDKNGDPNGSEQVVANQEIHQTWEDYARSLAEHRRATRDAQKRAAIGRESRARKLADLVTLAVGSGAFPDETSTIFNDEAVALIREFLPSLIVESSYVNAVEVRGPLARSWEDIIRYDKPVQVKADVLFEALR